MRATHYRRRSSKCISARGERTPNFRKLQSGYIVVGNHQRAMKHGGLCELEALQDEESTRRNVSVKGPFLPLYASHRQENHHMLYNMLQNTRYGAADVSFSRTFQFVTVLRENWGAWVFLEGERKLVRRSAIAICPVDRSPTRVSQESGGFRRRFRTCRMLVERKLGRLNLMGSL